MRRAALCLLWLAPLALAQSGFRVRIYHLNPPSSLTLTPQPSVHWKTCLKCAELTLGSPLIITVDHGRLRIPGASPAEMMFISGAYQLSGFQHPLLRSSFPLEIRADGQTLRLVLTMPLEEYVAAVLAAESAGPQPAQSLQAMAIAARTFAVRFRGRHSAEGFDFCDTTHCQDFHLSAITPEIRAAVEATEGELLWFQGRPAGTYYHQNCGGETADAADVWPGQRLPYLREHPDPYCVRAAGSKWQSTLDKSQIATALAAAGLRFPARWESFVISSRSPSGRVLELQFAGPQSDQVRTSASSFRFAVDRSLGWNQIRSDWYDLRDSGTQLTFTGRGSGHGVGLCQAGAAEMGREGKRARDILAFYYPGTGLGLTAQGLDWQFEGSERLEIVTTEPREDSAIAPAAESALRWAEQASGLQLDARPRLKIYPSLDVYRNSTGAPGWMAAFTYGSTIRLQPVALLRSRGILDSTLRHEFLHLLVEEHARPGLPLWFREGLVLYLSDPNAAAGRTAGNFDPLAADAALRLPAGRESAEQAYRASRDEIARLVQQNGKAAVLGWLARPAPFLLSRAGAP
jgi:stage II sporulation protein D